MMVMILKKMGLSDYRIRTVVEKYTRIKTMISAVFYTVMVFVVILGISADVYAGFSRPVPYVIIAIFLFMSFIRMHQFLLDDGYIGRTVEKTLKGDEPKRISRKEQDGISGSPDGKTETAAEDIPDAEEEPDGLFDDAEEGTDPISEDAEDEPDYPAVGQDDSRTEE